jgi:hypothetical protein
MGFTVDFFGEYAEKIDSERCPRSGDWLAAAGHSG